MTIDGSNAVGGTTRDLTITNSSISSPEVIDINSTGTTPVTWDVVKNCNLINGSQNSSAVILTDLAGTAGYFNNISIQNNSIQKAYIGIYNLATVLTGNGTGLNITGNDLNTSGANSVRLIGIYVQGFDGATIANNNIGNNANTLDASNLTGIWFATGTVNSTISGNTISNISGTSTSPRGIVVSSAVAANVVITGNTISGMTSSSTVTTYGIWIFSTTSGVTVQKNKISNIKNTNIGGWGCAGIDLASTSAPASITVANNFIFDVAAFGYAGGTTTDNGNGIVVESGSGYNLYYNSVSMNTNQTDPGYPAALNVLSAVTTAGAINLVDNIFSNSQTVGTERYAVYCAAASTVFSSIDYNDYYTTGANLGYMTAANVLDLAAWKTATGKDIKSVSGNPQFVSATDLHINLAVYSPVKSAGTPIIGFTDDIDGVTRAFLPNIGAAEGTYLPLTLSGTVTNVTCNGLGNGAISTVVGGGLAPYTYNWSNGGSTSNLSGLNAGSYHVTVTDGRSSTIANGWIVTEPAAMTLSFSAISASCPGTADGSINLNVIGGASPYNFLWSNGATTQNISGLVPGNYAVTVTDHNPCLALGNKSVGQISNVCANISVTGEVSTSQCFNATNFITVAGSGNLFTVKPGGEATFIAGVKISFMPGTTVQSGGKMVGRISTGTYCGGIYPIIPAAAVATGTDETPFSLEQANFTLYPNPTNGNFTLVQKGDRQFGNVKVEIYAMRGDRVLSTQMIGEKRHEFVTSGLQSGLYFVKVIADDYTETIKLIKTR